MKSFWTVFQEDDGAWSWGRTMGMLPLLTACFSVIYLSVKTHPTLDITIIGALAAFAICTFGASKAIQAWKDKGQPN